jgi:HTH-type transcriptional regulator/antitoxin HigA
MEMSTNALEAPGIKPVAAASKLSVVRYGNLLRKFAPKVIETPEENRLALQIVERLMSIGDGRRSAEENALPSLLAALVEQFERKSVPGGGRGAERGPARPDLIEHNGLKAADLADVMGGRSRVSEVLSGKRAISKEQAKRLGQLQAFARCVHINHRQNMVGQDGILRGIGNPAPRPFEERGRRRDTRRAGGSRRPNCGQPSHQAILPAFHRLSPCPAPNAVAL